MVDKLKMLRDDPTNAWYYVQGTVRLWLYENLPYLVRPHIQEQYEWRKKRAIKCLENKSCLFCGCKTPDLFFADKACGLEKVKDDFTRILIAQRKTMCYPAMMSKEKWNVDKKKLNKLTK